jgi:hypothetical protein
MFACAMISLVLAFSIPVGTSLLRAFAQGGFILVALVLVAVVALITQAEAKLADRNERVRIAVRDFGKAPTDSDWHQSDINRDNLTEDERDALGLY